MNYPAFNLTGKTPAATYQNILQYNAASSSLVNAAGTESLFVNVTASHAISASWAPDQTIMVASASWASQSFNAVSSSWTSVSISSSHADTSSYISFTNDGINTIIGVGAGPVSGLFDTTIVGYNAGKSSSGSYSQADGATIIGAHAAENPITTFLATIIGSYAGQNCKEPTGATLIGRGAGSNAGYAWGATIIGSSGPQSEGTCSFATMVGSLAGQNAKTASNATFIGRGADAATLTSNVEGSTAIGYNAKVSGSNMFIIGGTGADAVKVGIGTSSPQNTLEVVGNILASSVTASVYAPTTMILPCSSSTSVLTLTIQTGSMYFNATDSLLWIYTGTSWKSASLA